MRVPHVLGSLYLTGQFVSIIEGRSDACAIIKAGPAQCAQSD